MARKPKQKPAANDGPLGVIEDVNICGIMHDNYREYAAAVVVGRAIPDVRDGLKPVHRRILYTMAKEGYDWSAGFRKSARIVGSVMGMYHPHGDGSIYDAMARMTQPWSMTTILVDGQGNFGSPDGDSPAAMRYTEARLARISRFLLDEVHRGTVDFRPNYDETETEPVVLPAAFPNILVNGGSGIAVGLASSMPPHNLGEVIDATLLRLRNPKIGLEGLMSALPGPDFPTGGRIIGRAGLLKAYETGRGVIDVAATTHFEKDGRSPLIVYSDMPWGVTRPSVLARINELVSAGELPDVVSARDETDRNGARFVVELKPDADPELNDRILKTQTALRTGISLNFTLLDSQSVPREMGLAAILDEWISFRRSTVRRRATFDLRKARDRGRLLLGRMAALSAITKAIALIRQSKDRQEAIEALMGMNFTSADFREMLDLLGTEEQKAGRRFSLNREQAEDILAMRLQRLTGMEREDLEAEGRRIVAQMIDLKEILASPARLDQVIAEELEAVRAASPRDRLTVIDSEAEVQTARASRPLLPAEPIFVIETDTGFFARSRKPVTDRPLRRQVPADSHSRIVFFTADGNAYGLDAAQLPLIEDKAEPRPVPGLLGLTPSAEIVASLVLAEGQLRAEAEGGAVLCFISRDGMVRRTEAAEFARIPSGGKIAMKIGPDDAPLTTVFAQTPGQDASGRPLGGAVFMGTASGRVIRFSLDEVRVMSGRTSRGMRGMKLEDGDRIVAGFEVPDIAMETEACDQIERAWMGKIPRKDCSEEVLSFLDGAELVQVASSGHARRTLLAAYRQTRRDNRGVNDRGPAKTIGDVVAYALLAPGAESLMLRVAGALTEVRVETIRRGPKASTGGLVAESAEGLL